MAVYCICQLWWHNWLKQAQIYVIFNCKPLERGVINVSKYEYILWDWNGTLLDDVSANLTVINGLLLQRGLQPVTRERYRKIFKFPIIDFYRDVGFSVVGEDYEKLVLDYQLAYSAQKDYINLMANAERVLQTVQQASIKQLILSASSYDAIMDQMTTFDVSRYFNSIISLSNGYAYGKVGIAKQWLAETGVDPNRILIVGDTLHDYEVSMQLACDCLLISKGHQDLQSVSRAFRCSCVPDIIDVIEYVL